MSEGQSQEQRWLLLIYQLPSKPAYFRVKIWRRLQGIGAVAVKSTVYALPANAEMQEDFEWLLKEIVAGGGEAMICEARLVDGLSDAQVRAMFDAARDADYAEIAGEARELAAAIGADATSEKHAEARPQLGRLRKRLTEVVMIDFFGASGRLTIEGLIAELETQLTEDKAMTKEPKKAAEPSELKGRIWVTRRDVHVDRIACSWLIRRFIDADAIIRFVAGKGYVPKEGELRFDMFEGEITHEGDRCSFEVLLTRAGINDPALQAIAEIVHDIDLKDNKFGREEATGIASLIAGIAMANESDEQRIAQGAPVFDNLYQYFRKKRG
ncbi:ChrB protein [Mesorhizobium sp. LSJC268A00]|uniref:chromate resistance protein ChrB domain-containing protein n=1 Tax=unclassified Mesorhizobium TaxID=325217 RepID=UPI0003CE1091|nr:MULTISPECIES: chromate resistance protein ChrB domain-containing protein [unclassified Mesorhizobium]ESW82136.1 ChrB protein [Mesorhizobium sp. LSJC285A00]ESW93151.1 ChrB protein [Mesorhizobium sp. LSJC269B00]ESX06569.1 ChrB protein [Mesorhizobium sp. LSJC268A00]ESX27708.1 ChrB protein [Mesorhizobium sp. LSJC264A00]ESX63070.1 ChrB protein [Mesorhizobium sp. LSHC422A00]ESZ09233.1 ChrB protein [Mesorhizobium sp. L2C089B000]ESZ35183.1 ChrB protein [Mesorhizobium sp. L2C067A000]ESZ41621.1 Ch